MPIIRFAEWLPDLPDYESPGATVARNVISRARSYGPLKALSAFTPALTARCRGAASMTDKDGNAYNFAGDATKLYQVTAEAATNVSKSGGYANTDTDDWEIIQWGNTCIATNYADPVQTLTLGGANFADLFVSTLKPKARHLAVVRDFVVMGNTSDSSDGAVPNRVWWTAINDPTDADPDVSTQSDNQDLQGGGGWVQRVFGGEYGVVAQERSIWRMTYVGPPVIFQFDEVERSRGLLSPPAASQLGRLIFYLSDDGFYAFDGTTSIPIGANKVDRTFFAEADPTFYSRISCAIDPLNKLVFWAYPTANATGGNPDKCLIYNWVDQRWTDAEFNCELIFRSLSQGYTLDGLDDVNTSIDDLTPTLDSRAWTGGKLQFGAFDADHKMATFEGSNLEATLETAEFEPFPGQRTLVTEVRPVVDGGTPTMALGTRARINDSVSYSATVTQNANGFCPFRVNSRYFRGRMTVPAASTWNHAQGVEAVKASPMGRR